MTGLRSNRLYRSIISNKLTLLGFSIVAVLTLIALTAPLIAPFDPSAVHILDRLKGPDMTYLMGTDEYGRDIFSRVVFGTRVSMQVAILVTLISTVTGIIVGLWSGYFGGVSDFIIMRTIDGLMSFPALLLSLFIMAAFGPSTSNLILALSVVFIPNSARLTRNAVLTIRELEYVESSRAAGAGAGRIMFDHILPNCIPPLIINSTVVFGYAILSEAALSFLGFGDSSTSSWGAILSDGRDFMFQAPWISIYPGIAISIFVLGTNLAGDGLRDILDPRMG